MKILGLGTVAMDVMMEVDSLPAADSFGVINRVSYLPGGSGTNVIVQSARLGAECAYIAKLGDDPIGRDILSSLRNEKIDVSGMRIKEGGTSLHANIVVDKKGQKFILLNFGDAFGSLCPEEVSAQLISWCDVLFTDFYPKAAPLAALKAAKKQGKTTVFNMQTGLGTFMAFNITRDDVLEALPFIDIFAPCREGLRDLFGSDQAQFILPELRRHCKGLTVITQGSEGVLAIDENNQSIHIPAFNIQPVDTTGAGDSFIGAFMVAYLQQKQPLAQALRTANASAAYTCLGMGARSGPDATTLGEWIKKQS
ncbi:MAG: carbohydrate kinase family protein [Anaerolineaceae bacterium]|nr:carbohydrate kinase family protein [Anaerolineaceae bacterium]